jgi:Cu/Ag efflux pump CusA
MLNAHHRLVGAQPLPRRDPGHAVHHAGRHHAMLRKTPLDALPDLSDVQVIVYTEYPGQAPQVVEDQVTYPLTTAMLSVPKSKVVRGFSFFGASFVYIIFEDGTDIYWARSRVLEYLNFAAGRLPRGVTPQIGPTPPASAGSTSTPCWPRTRRWPNCAPCRTGTCATS